MEVAQDKICVDFDMWKILTENVNPHRVLTELFKSRGMTKEQYEEMIVCTNDQRLWRYILDHFQARLSISDFFRILFKAGYVDVVLQFSTGRLLKIAEIKSAFIKDASEKTFYMLKSEAYNKALLPNGLGELLRKYNQESAIYQENMEAADTLAFVLCAGIDTVIMSFSEKSTSHPWFEFLKSINMYTSNTKLFNVAFQSRLAIACATTGELEESKKYLSAGLVDSFGLSPCSVIINLYYFAAYIKGCEFEKNPSTHIKDQVLKFIDLGLQILQTQQSQVEKYWRKMFVLRKIYCFLGLSNKAYPISSFPKNVIEINEANTLLAASDGHRKNMDDRRKQLYLVADARGYQFQENLPLALEKLKEAIFLDKREVFGETHYIRKYKSELEEYSHVLSSLQKPEEENQHFEKKCRKLFMRTESLNLSTIVYKRCEKSGEFNVNFRELKNILSFHGLTLPPAIKDKKVAENDHFSSTFFEHLNFSMNFKDVKELRKSLCNFLEQTFLPDISKNVEDFISLPSNCFLSRGFAKQKSMDKRELLTHVVEKIQQEEFCGVLEIWGVACICNIPIKVLSFCVGEKHLEIISFNFKQESFLNPNIHIGHIYDDNHRFFPLDIEKELIYDAVSRKLPPKTALSKFCEQLDETLATCRTTSGSHESESYYEIMYNWHKKNPNTDHLEQLRHTLSNLEREDIIGVIDNFQKTEFSEFSICDQHMPVTDLDIRLVCTNVAKNYRHLVRCLGLPQNTLDILTINHPNDVMELVYQCLKKTTELKLVTRKDLCDGIEYACQNRELIQNLNSTWKKMCKT